MAADIRCYRNDSLVRLGVILRDVLDAARIIQWPKQEGRHAVHDGPVEAFLRELVRA